MNPHDVFCPNPDCPARGRAGEGNIWVHAHTPPRYRCTVCRRTFSPRAGTLFHRRQTDEATIIRIVTLVAHGCPIPAIEVAFGVQRQTVRTWQDAAGVQCEAVHHHLVGQPRDLGAVQADEIRVKQQGGVVWVALALQVVTRLWLGGAVSPRRDGALIARLCALVRACALPAPLLVCVDGFAAYVRQVRRMARTPQPRDGKRGRCRLVAWPGLVIGQVVKQRQAGRVVGVSRRLAHGTRRWAKRLLGGGTIQTAYIERLNGTFRARLASLARRTRAGGRTVARLEAGMWLVGTLYNFCTPHDSLRQGESPAMAAGISNHLWDVDELLHYHVPPPPWRPPKRWGRRTKAEEALIKRWAT
jgi:transposase-like protein